MKRNKFSTSIPAQFSDFQENGQLTKATLRVFHSGVTGDGRHFTKEFSNHLVNTIGGTPVVANYDEESKDFIGHAETQSVFGFVPESPIVKLEEIDGLTWLVTEVRLFTKRHDVGRIAKQIIGKSQSLELNPETVEFNILNDGKEIEFIKGDLIGLSVLGGNQKPAFGGSGFFTEVLREDYNIDELIEKYNSLERGIEVNFAENTVEQIILNQKKKKKEMDGYDGESITEIPLDPEALLLKEAITTTEETIKMSPANPFPIHLETIRKDLYNGLEDKIYETNKEGYEKLLENSKDLNKTARENIEPSETLLELESSKLSANDFLASDYGKIYLTETYYPTLENYNLSYSSLDTYLNDEYMKNLTSEYLALIDDREKNSEIDESTLDRIVSANNNFSEVSLYSYLSENDKEYIEEQQIIINNILSSNGKGFKESEYLARSFEWENKSETLDTKYNPNKNPNAIKITEGSNEVYNLKPGPESILFTYGINGVHGTGKKMIEDGDFLDDEKTSKYLEDVENTKINFTNNLFELTDTYKDYNYLFGKIGFLSSDNVYNYDEVSEEMLALQYERYLVAGDPKFAASPAFVQDYNDRVNNFFERAQIYPGQDLIDSLENLWSAIEFGVDDLTYPEDKKRFQEIKTEYEKNKENRFIGMEPIEASGLLGVYRGINRNYLDISEGNRDELATYIDNFYEEGTIYPYPYIAETRAELLKDAIESKDSIFIDSYKAQGKLLDLKKDKELRESKVYVEGDYSEKETQLESVPFIENFNSENLTDAFKPEYHENSREALYDLKSSDRYGKLRLPPNGLSETIYNLKLQALDNIEDSEAIKNEIIRISAPGFKEVSSSSASKIETIRNSVESENFDNTLKTVLNEKLFELLVIYSRENYDLRDDLTIELPEKMAQVMEVEEVDKVLENKEAEGTKEETAEKEIQEIIEEETQENEEEAIDEETKPEVEEEDEKLDSEEEGTADGNEEETDFSESGVESKEEKTEADSYALDSQEREELAAYRKEHKARIIQEYVDYLDEDTIEEFTNDIDNYSVADLDRELAYKSMTNIKNGTKSETKGGVAFTYRPNVKKDDLESLVKQNL